MKLILEKVRLMLFTICVFASIVDWNLGAFLGWGVATLMAGELVSRQMDEINQL